MAPSIRRLLIRSAVALTAIAVGFGCVAGVSRSRSEQRLRSVVADLDAAGPWRLADLRASQPPNPTGTDATSVVGKVAAAVSWRRYDTGSTSPLAEFHADKYPPECVLTAIDADRLADQVADFGTVWASWPELLTVAPGHLATGFVAAGDITAGFRPLDEIPAHIIDIGGVAYAATALALFFADARQPREATVAVRGAIHAAGLGGDDIDGTEHSCRLARVAFACRTLERVLGQCEPADADLAAVFDRLDAGALQPMWRKVLDGDRASLSAALASVQDRSKPLSDYVSRRGWRALLGDLDDQIVREVRPLHADMLLAYTEALAHADEPPHTQAPRIAALRAKLNASLKAAGIEGWFTDEMQQQFERLRLSHARIACTHVAITAERHRLRTGAYPATLPDLPRSPFSGGPLRYALTPTGAEVSDPAATRDGETTSVQFRLFLPPHRHQPADPRRQPE